MRPATVHLLAQGIRFLRGTLTEIEKWIVQTPPERLAVEAADALRLVRAHVTQLETSLSAVPVTIRTGPEIATTPRPADPASRPEEPGAGPWP